MSGIVRKHRWLAVVIALVTLVSVACSSSGGDETSTTASASDDSTTTSGGTDTTAGGSSEEVTLEIGALMPLTDTGAVYGVPHQRGIQIAVDEVNASGELGSVTLELVEGDTQSDTATAIAQYRNIAANDGIVAILCCTVSTVGVPLKDVAIEEEVPTIIMGAAAPGLGEPPWIYRTIFDPAQPDSLYERTVDALVANEDPKTAVMVVTSDSESFANTADVWINKLEEHGVEVLDQIDTLQADTEFDGPATQIVALDPDVVIAHAFSNGIAQLMRSLRDFGYEGPVVGNYGSDQPSIAEIAGEAVADLYFAPTFSPLTDDPIGSAFVDTYTDLHGEDPDYFAAQGYNAIMFLKEAIIAAQQSGEDLTRETIADGMSMVDEWATTNGVYRMENGEGAFDGIPTFVRWTADGVREKVWGE